MVVSNGIFDQGPGARQETDMFRPGRFFECCKIQRYDREWASLEGVEGWIYIDDGRVYGMVVHAV